MKQEADSLYKEKKYEEAETLYDTLILKDSLDGYYYFKRGFCKSMNLKITEAKEDYLKAIALNYIDKKKAFLNLGTLYRFQGNYDSAIYFYDESLKVDSNFTKAITEKNEVIKILKKIK